MSEAEFIEMVEANIANLQRDITLYKAGKLNARPLAYRSAYNGKWIMEAADDLKAAIDKK